MSEEAHNDYTVMLLALLTALHQSHNGPERFRATMQSLKSFSVHVVCHSGDTLVAGNETLLVSKPSSIALHATWGKIDYSYVKSPQGAIEYNRYAHVYQEYEPSRGLSVEPSMYTRMQNDSLPRVLLDAEFGRFLPRGIALRFQSATAGVETYAAKWGANGESNLTVGIDSAGRMRHFHFRSVQAEGTIDRTFDFSNYVVNPRIPPNAFALVPPVGLTTYRMPYHDGTIRIGEKASLGQWASSRGPVNMDSEALGKLLVVRELDSPPADRLLAFLRSKKLPAQMLVLSLANHGGDFWSPTPALAAELRADGTPLILLIGRDEKIKAAWMGFDPDQADKLLDEITKAASE